MAPRHSSDAFLGNDAGSAGSTGFGDAPADAGSGFGGGAFGDGGFGGSPAGAGSPDSAASGSTVQFGDGNSDIVQQARGRSGGFLFGEDRAIGSPPNWEARDSTQLYHGATTANDPGTAESVGQSWAHHGKELETAANELYHAISELGAAWVGQGAAAAQGTLIAIANSSSQAAQAAHSMGSRMTQQAAAAAEVKKMPAPKEFDPAQQMSAMLAGGPAAMVADMKAQSDAAKEVKAQQVQHFNAYTKSMSEVDDSTPSFGPQSIGLKPAATTGSGGASLVGMTGVPQASPAGGPAGAGAPAGAPVAGGAGETTGVPAQSEFAQAGYVPGEGAAPAPNSGLSSGASGAASSGPAAPAAAGPAGPSNVAQSLGTAAVGGGLGFAGARALSSGSRSGSSKQSNDDTQTAADPKSVGNSATANAPQGQGVVPPSGTIGGGGANAASGHGGAPMAPMGGGMGAGGAGSQQEQDHSHASFLIEPDPDDAFGATEATPPPVIGAWSDDEES